MFSDEIKDLMKLYKKTKHYKARERYHAVLLVKAGKKIKEVAEIFYVDDETIRLWVQRWETEKNMLDKQRSGKPPKLTKEEEEELCGLVDENNPEEHGYNVSTWDCVELKKYVKEYFNKDLSDECLRLLLKRNSFNYKKVNYLFNKRDLGLRNNFVNEILGLYEA